MITFGDFTRFTDGKVLAEEDLRNNIEIKIIPGEGQQEQATNFTWNITTFNSNKLIIQLYFLYPEQISTGFTRD